MLSMTSFIFLFNLFAVRSLFQVSGGNSRQKLKGDILSLAQKTKRGLIETPEEKQLMAKLFASLEKLNPNKASLESKFLPAVWKLEYTTSDGILGRTDGNERVGNIYQQIDTKNLRAQNSEVVKYFKLFNIPRKVTANLTPLSKSKVKVQFDKFSVGPLQIKAPASSKVELDITYVDEDLRLSRGDKGNIFVLTRYSDLKGVF